MSNSKESYGSVAAVLPADWVVETEAERDAIREQLRLILASPLFRNSRRFPNFLRYAVESVLKGEGGNLKERTIGVDVFGRDPQYDTNHDPTVRMTAVEVRKRLAQYYKAPGRETEIRIDLPAGSYVPEFHPPAQFELPKLPAVPVSRRNETFSARWFAAVAGLGLLAIVLTVTKPWLQTNSLDRFWGPVLNSASPVLICISGHVPRSESKTNDPEAAPNENTLTYLDLLRRNRTPYSDALALSNITSYLGSRGKPYRVRLTSETGLDDLRDGPAVLIGAFNNPWTMQLLSQARFSFVAEGPLHYILDRQNPTSRKWQLVNSLETRMATLPEDYALISRVLEPATGRLVVTAAGIMPHGTKAAGEFLSQPAYLAQAEKLVPGDWKHKNIQVVIASKVIGENAGPPRILAAYLW
jgi:hypothetical protein